MEQEEGIIFLELPENEAKVTIKIDGVDVSADRINITNRSTTIDSLSVCDVLLDNYKGKYNDEWEGGETVELYSDYLEGTTKKYTGKLDNARPGMNSNGARIMRITSRAYPELQDMNYIGTFTEQAGDSVLKSIIDDINTRAGYTIISYTSSSIQSASKTITQDFRELSYLSSLKLVIKILGYEARIDTDGVFYAFPQGSKINNDVTIMSGINVWSCPEFGKDRRIERNRIRVYGQEKENCLIGWMEKDDVSIDKTWIKEQPINDTSISTEAQAIERALAEKTEKATAENKGTVICLGLSGLIPGYKIDANITYVLDGKFIVKEWTDVYSISGFDSSVTLSEREISATSIIKQRERETEFLRTYQNPNGMDNWYHFTFNDDSQISTHSNTETSEGKLRLKTEDADAGITNSITFSLPYTPSSCELRVNGNDDNDLATYDITFDSSNYQNNINVGLKGEPGSSVGIENKGTNMILRINMKSDTQNPLPSISALTIGIKE